MAARQITIRGGILTPVELRAPNFSGRRPWGLSNPWVIIFTETKVPAASWIAARGLDKSWAVIFTEKKSACGKLDSSNGACQILGGHFHPQKSACGKLVSSNRACQSPDHGCIMGFGNHRVTFRSAPHAQNRGTILMGKVGWRVTEKNENRNFRASPASRRARPPPASCLVMSWEPPPVALHSFFGAPPH